MSNIKDKYKNIDSEKFNLHIDEHLDENKKFNYDSYVRTQTEANIKKLNNDGPRASRLIKISQYIKKHIPDITFGICHGSRNGAEQKIFKQQLKVPVIGTDISYTAEQFPDTIQWDFHEVKEEWLGAVSFIFSNSLDHSYDPIKCLNAWMSCISSNGKIFLQRGSAYIPRRRGGSVDGNWCDIFQCTDDVFEEIVNLAGNNEWTILYPEELGPANMGRDKIYVVLERK